MDMETNANSTQHSFLIIATKNCDMFDCVQNLGNLLQQDVFFMENYLMYYLELVESMLF